MPATGLQRACKGMASGWVGYPFRDFSGQTVGSHQISEHQVILQRLYGANHFFAVKQDLPAKVSSL